MTPSELKYQYCRNNPDGHFFDRDTMQASGDTMKNYGVRKATIVDRDGFIIDCWELYRRHAVKLNQDESAYFTKDTFTHVFGRGLNA